MLIEQATHLINMRSKMLFIEGSNDFEDKLEAYRNIRLHATSFLKSGALEALINLGAVVAKAIKDCYTDEQLEAMTEFLTQNAYKTENLDDEDDTPSDEPVSQGKDYDPTIETSAPAVDLGTVLEGIIEGEKSTEPLVEDGKKE